MTKETQMQLQTQRQVSIPSSIRYASTAMYVGAVSSVIAALVPVIDRATGDKLTQEVQAAYPDYTAAETNSEASATFAFLAVTGIIGVLLWLWMARANTRGQRWARVTATSIFVVASAVPFSLSAIPVPAFITAVWWISCAIGLVAVVLLWTPASSPHFAASKRPRGDG